MSRRRDKEVDPAQPTLLEHAVEKGTVGSVPAPLAERMRPRDLSEIVGQKHLLGPGSALAKAIAEDRVGSLILWGDPGSGKTTLAHVISKSTRAVFVPFSAVLGGVADLRKVVSAASERKRHEAKRTILFVDEIHRFNRAQQDAFLPHVENGTITLIGATTENPSFNVNAALLSRAKVLRLEPLTPDDIVTLLQRAVSDAARGLGGAFVELPDAVARLLAASCNGDARRALNQLESLAQYVTRERGGGVIDEAALRAFSDHAALLYDKHGEEHYNVVSAFIKSLRGSDPDAAMYWLMRMLDAGEDPLFISRRMMIFASEDVGNADPRGIQVATAADAAFRRLGMPEGIYPLANACLYLACCPKSNAVKGAISTARAAVQQHGSLPVPKKLRNAVTPLMKTQGYGDGYKYAHDFEGHIVPGESYLPDQLVGARFYEPTDQGLEQHIADRLRRLRSK